MLWAQLGPLGSMVDLPDVAPVQISAERPSSELITLGSRRYVDRAGRAPRAWAISTTWLQPEAAAFLAACAQNAVPGPLHLLTSDAAAANLLPPHLAAPGSDGDTGWGALGSAPAAVVVPGVGPLRGVAAPPAMNGPWSQTIAVRPSVGLALTCWGASDSTITPGQALLTWRTVNAGGAQLASGAVTATSTGTTVRASATFTPSSTAVGVQVQLQAVITGTVTALRLTEGAPPATPWAAGAGGARVIVEDPTQTLNLVRAGTSYSDYAWVLKEVG